jgi:starvation-inducible DNA-binding protein
MDPDIGIGPKDRAAIVDGLKATLADTYALYQKTHLFHWNVQGPRFGVLHPMFGDQYNALWTALDEIAERIRALGHLAPSHDDLAKLASIPTPNDPAPEEDAMLRALLSGHEAIVKTARTCLKRAADGGDEASADLMTERVAYSEKTAWMLRAHLAC